MEQFEITRPGAPYQDPNTGPQPAKELVLPDDHQLSLLTDAPHFCPQCRTGFGCEDKPCTLAYESTCKSCIADPVGDADDTPTG